MTGSLNQRIRQLLSEQRLPYTTVQHPPVENCDSGAMLRGTPLEIGGKSLLFRSKRGFSMFVISAAYRLNSKRVRSILGQQKVRFASDEELFQLTGAVKGAVPPFGGRLFDCELFIDETIYANREIVFTCGLLTESVIMQVSDYLKLVQGIRVDCCHPYTRKIQQAADTATN